MKTMYPAQANSPGTELAEAINAQQTTIKIVDSSVVPEAPNLLTIGSDESTETILFTQKNGNVLTGVTRGYQGIAQSWSAGIKVARYITAYDHDTFKSNIEDLYKQIDATDLTTTLGPGTSVINADQASAVDLTFNGQTRNNILGPVGNFEVDSNGDGVADGWANVGDKVRFSLVTTNVKYGLKAQRITALATDTAQWVRRMGLNANIIAGKKYAVVADVVTDGTATGHVQFRYSDTATVSKGDITSNTIVVLKASPIADYVGGITLYNSSLPGVAGWVQFDGVGIYEVSDDLYNRIGVDINETNIRDYLPHVDGVQHVQGASVYHPGKNIVDSVEVFFESSKPTVLEANNTITVSSRNSGVAYVSTIRKYTVAPNTNYTISFNAVKVAGDDPPYIRVRKGSDGSNIMEIAGEGKRTATFNTGSETEIWLFLYATAYPTGAANQSKRYENIQIELGDKATPFEPAKPQQLSIPETLAEVAGVRDEVRVGLQGATLVRRVVRNFMLDGSLTWGANQNYEGYKRVITTLSAGSVDSERVIKYTGQLLQHTELPGVQWTGPDMSRLADYNNIRALGITISNSESGWTLSGSPSEKAVKALMNGWKANGTNGTVYNSWVSILDGKAPATNTEAYVSSNKAPGWTAWATVDCALDKPEIKPIKTEGAISLHSGGNQLTVSAGLVQREKAKLFYSSNTKKYYINGNQAAYMLSKRAERILQVYKGANPDSSWYIGTTSPPTVSGTAWAEANEVDIDPNADYYVTYTTLDKYDYTANVTQLDVSYKAGISATLSDLVQGEAALKAQNDRQDFADTYIQAYSENNRLDLDNLTDTVGDILGSVGKPNGIAGLDKTGKVPSTQLDLPSNLETTTGAEAKVKAHADLTNVHGATSAATPSRIMMRDSAGRAKVAAPSAADDIALKSTVDNAVGTLSSLLTTAKGNTVAAINELFTNVSNGKDAVAAAITGKDVPASGSDTFPQLAAKIGQIPVSLKGSVVLDYANPAIQRTDLYEDTILTLPPGVSFVHIVSQRYYDIDSGPSIDGWRMGYHISTPEASLALAANKGLSGRRYFYRGFYSFDSSFFIEHIDNVANNVYMESTVLQNTNVKIVFRAANDGTGNSTLAAGSCKFACIVYYA